ncbi:MAG: Acyl-coenzyme A thioesterase PaaI [Actinobacteria bacterium ADurb.Bin346]|nr:MAG: Acyl-coenzyme A thioesterase PaaI [Actinobacteria bacterium ADurb.Bin346]
MTDAQTDAHIIEQVKKNIEAEPYAMFFGIKILELTTGHSVVTMKAKKEYDNIFSITHGGAIFSLLDVAFGSAVNSYGTVAVALNVNINYIKPSTAGDVLIAEAIEETRSNRIASFSLSVKKSTGEIVATAQSIAYLKNEKLPFLV